MNNKYFKSFSYDAFQARKELAAQHEAVLAALKAYYQSRFQDHAASPSVSPDSLMSRESSEARDIDPSTQASASLAKDGQSLESMVTKLQQEKQVYFDDFVLHYTTHFIFDTLLNTVPMLFTCYFNVANCLQELEEARDTLMKRVNSTSRQQEVLEEELHKAIGETESLCEENAELAEQLSPPAYKKQLSVDPFDLDEGEWRVR